MTEDIDSDGDLARALAGRSVAELRAAYERSIALGQEILVPRETLLVQGLMNLREIGDRLCRNGDANVRAIFDLTEKHVHARSASETCELQRQFLDEQSERLTGQLKDLETLVSAQLRTFHDEFGRESKV